MATVGEIGKRWMTARPHTAETTDTREEARALLKEWSVPEED